jgi:hypothetical protein
MRKLFLFVAVALIAVIAGCQGEVETGGDTDTFVGGTNGLLISFLENSPPSEVTDGGTFPFKIIVNLENAGESPIASGKAKVTISGPFPRDFVKTDGTIMEAADFESTIGQVITAVKKNPDGINLPGGKVQVEFPEMRFARQLQGTLKLPLRAEVCYVYSTRSSGLYCMKKNLLSTEPGVCEISGIKKLQSSGSPVQVESLTESIGGQNRVILTFKISHRGNGQIYKVEADEAGSPKCDSSGRSISDKNVVKVKIESPGIQDSDISCTPLTGGSTTEGFVRLDKGTGVVTCTIKTENIDAVKEVTAYLEFEYLDSKETTLTVKRLLTTIT